MFQLYISQPFSSGTVDLSKVNRLLIIRLSSLGDILLTLPLIRSIKKQYHDIKIDFLAREEYKDTLLYNPYINELLTFKHGDNSVLFNRIKEKQYGLVLDLQNNLRSARIAGMVSAPKYKFIKRRVDKILLVNFKIDRLKSAPPVPVRYAETLPGFKLDNNGLELFIPEEKTSRLKGDNYIALCPGSRHFTKMWPEEYFVKLGNMLVSNGYRVILLGGSSDREACGRISRAVTASVDLSGDNDLLQIATDMKECRLVICNDSGLMHAACAVNIPVVVFFGSTVSPFGFAPYKNKNLILENNSLTCRPCSHIGRGKCPRKHFRCMLDITPEIALNGIKSLL